MAETEEMSIYESTFAKSNKTDAILVVQDKEMHVNKAALSFHSDFFNSFLKSKSSKFNVRSSDEFEVFAHILSLVSGSPIQIEAAQVESLLVCSEKFQLPAAKRHLELFLMSSSMDFRVKLRIAQENQLSDLMEFLIEKITPKDFYIPGRPYEHAFLGLSDETHVKLFHKLLQMDGLMSEEPKTTETPGTNIYESTFAQSDKTDAILVVQEKKMHVNKEVLSYYSDYFKSLFNEKPTQEIPIEDVKFEDFATFLSFLHPNPIMPTIENSEKLLELAEQFQIPFIKILLEFFLISSSLNRLEKVKIGDKYQLEGLLMQGISLFESKSEINHLEKSDVFQSLSAKTKTKFFYKYMKIQ